MSSTANISKRIIISGGGTGGHIFPAISIAQEIKRRDPKTEILFVGAVGGMELRVVPSYGYEIKSVWISGIHRQLTLKNIWRNLSFPLKLVVSLIQASRVVSQFKPDAVIGVGGFASGPVGRIAIGKKIPLILCEQNAYPGLVNKWLASGASKILLGNAAAEKYFPQDKTELTGNPIRSFELLDRNEAVSKLGLDAKLPVILSLGGSLGARSINQAILANLEKLIEADVQLLWQCGKRYYDDLVQQVPEHPYIRLMAFIEDMALAYSGADLVISRAGGSTISEMIALSKTSILVPSPNVAEDHQTKNALSLSERGASILIKDVEAHEKLIETAIATVNDSTKLSSLQQNIEGIEKHNAAKEIVDKVMETIE